MRDQTPYFGIFAALLAVTGFVGGALHFGSQKPVIVKADKKKHAKHGSHEKNASHSGYGAGNKHGAASQMGHGVANQGASVPEADMTLLQTLVSGAQRSPKNVARDSFRHPAETLQFFGMKSDMKVVEIWPGGGWYTEIIAPYLKDKGTYIAATRDRSIQNENVQRSLKKFDDNFVANPQLFGPIQLTELGPNKTVIAPENSVDMVVSFRNVHNWMKFGFERDMFAAVFKALKPGGIFGMVEHRQNPDVFQDPQALTGYVTQSYVIDMAKEAGFVVAGQSEINANPKDTRSHQAGVWSLPPVLRLKELDREKYMAIGESDRMTVRFIKPMPQKAEQQ